MNFLNYELDKLLKEESIVIVFTEGKGDYQGTGTDIGFHPLGRMGCKVEAYKNGEEICY